MIFAPFSNPLYVSIKSIHEYYEVQLSGFYFVGRKPLDQVLIDLFFLWLDAELWDLFKFTPFVEMGLDDLELLETIVRPNTCHTDIVQDVFQDRSRRVWVMWLPRVSIVTDGKSSRRG
jgi:hypothetical protein